MSEEQIEITQKIKYDGDVIGIDDVLVVFKGTKIYQMLISRFIQINGTLDSDNLKERLAIYRLHSTLLFGDIKWRRRDDRLCYAV